MKRFTFGMVVASVLVVGAYTVVGAQGTGPGPGGNRAGGPGAGRGAMMMLRGLDLTDEQRAQVRTIFQGQRDSRDSVRAEAQLHRQLRAALFAEAPDGQRLADLQQQLAQAHADRLAAQIAIGQQVAQVLTADQRAAVRERLAQAPVPGGPGGQPGQETKRGRRQVN